MACEGVKDAKVDVIAKTATVVVDEDSADVEKLIAAVNATGRGPVSVVQD
jgi:copper chaperone CopZ